MLESNKLALAESHWDQATHFQKSGLKAIDAAETGERQRN